MRESGDVQVDDAGIGASYHSLVWMELGRVMKQCGNHKRQDKEMASC